MVYRNDHAATLARLHAVENELGKTRKELADARARNAEPKKLQSKQPSGRRHNAPSKPDAIYDILGALVAAVPIVVGLLSILYPDSFGGTAALIIALPSVLAAIVGMSVLRKN